MLEVSNKTFKLENVEPRPFDDEAAKMRKHVPSDRYPDPVSLICMLELTATYQITHETMAIKSNSRRLQARTDAFDGTNMDSCHDEPTAHHVSATTS